MSVPARFALLVAVSAACFATQGGSASAAWQMHDLPGDGRNTRLLGISCPSVSMCVAVGEGSIVASSAAPADGPWKTVQIGQGLIERERPPRFPGAPPPPDPSTYRDVHGISCPSEDLCVAVSFDGYVFWSSDPTGPADAWHAIDVDGTERHSHLMGISCPTVSLCVAVSGERYTAGKVLSSTDPTGGPGAWSEAQLDESLDLRGVSCGTPKLCVAVGENGRTIVSTNPTGGLLGWQDIGLPGGPGDMRGISCAGSSFCAAGNFGGNILTSPNPTAGSSAWSERNAGGSVLITGISCLETPACVAVDNNGDVISSTKPLGGSSDWSFQNVIPFKEPVAGSQPDNAMFGVSCPSSSFCAIAAASSRVFTSTSPFGESSQASSDQGKRRPLRPRTRLAHVDRRHTLTAKRWAPIRFRFYADGGASGFLCGLEARPIKRCKSPKRYRRVPIGKHVFRVRAIGPTGLKGPIALERFRIVANPNAKGR